MQAVVQSLLTNTKGQFSVWLRRALGFELLGMQQYSILLTWVLDAVVDGEFHLHCCRLADLLEHKLLLPLTIQPGSTDCLIQVEVR